MFLRLDRVVLQPPWPAAAAIAVVLGVLALALAIARRFETAPGTSALNIAGSFVLVTALVAACVQATALLGLASLGVLRVMGGALAVTSLGLLRSPVREWLRTTGYVARTTFAASTVLQRWAIIASAVTIVSLILASLGPPTDIDSIAYHLSVPLNWLAHGGAYPTPDWLHSRLTGIGESLNLLGLAVGTDCLGSVFQATAVLLAVTALASVAATTADKIFALALVAGCPLLPYFALTSKPQLLPAAATSVALALFVAHRRTQFARLSNGTLWLIFGCASFAMACKYSFIPAAGGLAAATVLALRRTHRGFAAVRIGLSAFALVALPVYARNLAFYGDPLTPVLERLRPVPDPVLAAFSWYLRNFAGDHSWRHLLRLPWDLVVATSPSQLTSVLGVGALAVLVSPIRRQHNWDVIITAIAVTLVGVAFGQLHARFFFESYLWLGLAGVLAARTVRKRVLFVALSAQMLVTMPIALYGAGNLFPGAISSGARNRALTRFAADYSLAQWLDRVLPLDAVVATDRGPTLFMPRPTVHADLAQMAVISALSESARHRRILDALTRGGANTLVVTSPAESSPFGWLVPTLGAPMQTSPVYEDAVRNPWKRSPSYNVAIYDLRSLYGQRRPN